MSQVLNGYPASEGMASGPVCILSWGVPEVPHRTMGADEVEGELQRFDEARKWAKGRLEELRQQTEERLGQVEGRIFEPQILMVDDPEVVDGTTRYIRENHLTAARAFEWRMLELRDKWTRTSHPMVLDRLNDLEDLQVRMLHRLMDLPDPFNLDSEDEAVIVVARNLTPSLVMLLDPKRVLGFATELGTRTSHWAMLARSLGMPAVVGVGKITTLAEDGQEMILDGRVGKLVLNPSSRDRVAFQERRGKIREWEEEIAVIAGLEAVTKDGQPVTLRANLDLPVEAADACSHGAQGVGLLRTEFLVVGRMSVPDEEEQYQAYKHVAESFPGATVIIRTFDLGGDKFPMFLHMPAEDNPFLGWRGIRVCLDLPDLFRPQLRALLRATAHGDVRLMIPMVNDVEEIEAVRALLNQEEDALRQEGHAVNAGYKVGILIETPAAALEAAELARHCDFFSIGTNDLVQYTLAVDRTNARLAKLYNPFHPAVVRQIHQVARVSRAAGIELSVCGELATNPLGAFLLMGLDILALSVAWPAVPEIKKVIREFRMEDARIASRKALAAATSREVTSILAEGVGDAIDLAAFSGRWNLSLSDSASSEG